jgi:hypothetical protein
MLTLTPRAYCHMSMETEITHSTMIHRYGGSAGTPIASPSPSINGMN